MLRLNSTCVTQCEGGCCCKISPLASCPVGTICMGKELCREKNGVCVGDYPFGCCFRLTTRFPIPAGVFENLWEFLRSLFGLK